MTRLAAQLSLFTKRRAAALPPAPEFAVHCMIADTLRASISPGWLWFHVGNGELRNKATAGKLKRMGVKPGVSDFLLVAPTGGRLHALELKAKGRKPTEEQMAFICAVLDAGGKASWVDTFEAAISQLQGWGAVRVRL